MFLIRIGADRIPRIYVLNKIDLCDKKEFEKKTKFVKPYIAISAKHGIGYKELKNEIKIKKSFVFKKVV